MSKNVEVWTQPETGSFTKKIASLPWSRIGFNRGVSIVGQGQVTLPASYDRLDELIDPANNTGSVIRVWQDGQNVESFYADEVTFDEEKQGTVTISGPNIEHGLEKGIVYPWDWTAAATETQFPDWVYGIGSSIIADISFDDAIQSPLVNGDFEAGDASGWSVFGEDEDNPVTLQVINNPTNAYEGNYFVIVDPTKVHGGLKQTGIKVYPGKTNTFSARVKGPGPIGDRITMAYRADEGTVGATGSPYFQTYYSGEIQAELDNAAYETGATDGTWQEIIMNATWGPGQEDTDLYVQYDEHGKANGELFWLDAFTMGGFGVGVGPWEAVGTEWMTVFEGSSFIAHSGTQSLAMSMSGIAQPLGAVGLRQPIDFEEGAPYTAEVWVWTPTAGTPTVKISISQADGGAILASATADLVASTWTRLELTVTPPAGILEGFIGLAWNETTAGTLYVDDFDVKDGLPSATAGKIMGDALTAITTRDGADSALLWLKWDSWDETYDSNGQLWGEELDMSVSRGMTIRQLLDRLKDWGVEWEVVWNVGSAQYELRLYKKFDGTTGGAGGASTVRLIAGKSFRSGQVRLRDGGPNTWLAEGSDGTLFEKQSAAMEAGYGRVESYIAQGNAQGPTTLESIIDTQLVESENQKFGIKAALFQRPFPLLDFDLGDRPEVNLPPHLPDDTYRVVGYTGAWDASDDSDEYTINFSTHVFDDPFGGTTSEATSAGLNYLLGKYEGLDDVERVSGSSTSESGTTLIERAPTITVAASNALQLVKNHADIVCTGVNDEAKINEAILRLPTGRGRIVLTEGDFYILAVGANQKAIVVPDNVEIVGTGISTILHTYGDVPQTQYGFFLNNGCTMRDLRIDVDLNDEDTFWAVYMNGSGSQDCLIDNVHFTGMDLAKGLDLVYLYSDYRSIVTNSTFRDINGIGFECWWGTVSSCVFEGTGTMLLLTGIETQIIGNQFVGTRGIKLQGATDSLIIGNNFREDSDFGVMQIEVNGTHSTTIIGNSFKGPGWDTTDGGVVFTGTNRGTIVNDNVFYESDLRFNSLSYNDEITIVGNNFGDSRGIIGGYGFSCGNAWRLRFANIANNTLGGWYSTGDPAIDLGVGQGATTSLVEFVNISGNEIAKESFAPAIGVRSTQQPSEGSIIITDNDIRFYGTNQPWGIEFIGDTLEDNDTLAVKIEGNLLRGSKGIHVLDGRHVTVKNNTMPFAEGATEFYADREAGQVWIEGDNEYAFVSSNDVSLGDRGDQTTLGGVINVEASLGGMVQENTVIGHEVGGVDTAINVDGPLYIANNSYMGVGPRWASAKTPLSNGLVVTGTGAVIGDNNMAVDISGATTPSFERIDSDRWTSSVALTVVDGLIEVPFRGDVEIVEVEAYLGTQPTGSAVTIDLNLNGTTMYTTQANRPSVAIATNSDTTVPDITAIADGDTLSVDIDAIDSNGIGAGLSVTVRYRRA